MALLALLNWGMIVKQKALKVGRYHKAGHYPESRLAAYAAETNKAIADGVTIPLFDFHQEVDERSALNQKGKITKVEVEDGWLGYEMEVADDATRQAIQSGAVQFTSPEFRESFTDGRGRSFGPLIRHVALTAKPRNPIQGKFEELPSGVARFSLDDFAGDDEEKKKKPGEGDEGEGNGESGEAQPETKADENPDMPPRTNDTKKMAAVVAGLAELGVILPSDFTFDTDGALDVLLTGLNTAVKGKQESEAEKQQDEDQPETEDFRGGAMQFSEDEIAALPAKAQAVIRRNQELEQQAVRFAEERDTAARQKQLDHVRRRLAKAPAFKDQIAARMETVRFSEEQEPAMWKGTEVADLLAQALQFAEPDDATDVAHQDGEQHFTDEANSTMTAERAKALNDKIDQQMGFKPRTAANAA